MAKLRTGLFAGALFLGSFLLFLVQPMQGKVLLPLLGGTPAVWNTCMVFFQGALLLGYLYAHLVATRLAPRTQVVLHLVVLALPFVLLPPSLPDSILQSRMLTASPLTWLLFALALSSGPAFLAVSTTSPLLQSWFDKATPSGAKRVNPYVLYAAGNAGSLLALIAYPFIVEPYLRLDQQMTVWTVGYGVLYAAVAVTAVMLFRSKNVGSVEDTATLIEAEKVDDDEDSMQAWLDAPDGFSDAAFNERLRWVLLAFVPSSLMLGVTTFMTTDVAAIPMLWLLPLTLYILSFVIVFAKWTGKADGIVRRLLPLFMLATTFLFFTDYRQHLWAIIAVHLTGFFLAALTCHGRMALLKPNPRRLTEFYFCLSLGGVLGGAFNSLLAPTVFTSIAEYPLLLALAIMLCHRDADPVHARALRYREVGWAVAAFALLAITMRVMAMLYGDGKLESIADAAEGWLERDVARSTFTFLVPVLLAGLTFYFRPLRLGAATLGLAVVALLVDPDATIIHRERSFFGVLTVKKYEVPPVNTLVHGGILHGEQRMDTEEERAAPRSYYHKDGPLGALVEQMEARVERPRIGAIGLGTGALAAYGKPTTGITFFELDPHVEALARDTRYFTYLDDCQRRWCDLKVEIGDGRLGMLRSEQTFDLIVVDAFSSDAIPIHLLTLEAMQTYLSKLNEGGVLAFHISNRYVDLEPVLLNVAKESNLGYAVRSDEGDESVGKGASTWAILAREDGDFTELVKDDRWRGLEPKDGVGLWQDDYANVVRAFTWF